MIKTAQAAAVDTGSGQNCECGGRVSSLDPAQPSLETRARERVAGTAPESVTSTKLHPHPVLTARFTPGTASRQHPGVTHGGRAAPGARSPPLGAAASRGRPLLLVRPLSPGSNLSAPRPTVRFKFSVRTLDGVQRGGRDGDLTYDIHVSALFPIKVMETASA